MFKSLLSLMFLFLLVAATGCQALVSDRTVIRGSGVLGEEARDLPTFSAIRVASSVDVTLTTGAEQQVIARADDNVLPYLRTEVEGDTLVIDLRADSTGGLFLGNLSHPPEVQVTAPAVVDLAVSSSGDLAADRLEGDRISLSSSSSGNLRVGNVKGNAVSIRASSSGDIDVGELNATELDVDLSSSGGVTVAGEAQQQTVSLSSSGNYQAGDLRSDTARVTVSSSGNATVWVTGDLQATRSSSGEVRYYGDPSVRGEAAALGGR